VIALLLGWAGITYVVDVVLTPSLVAKAARRAAGRKPVLNVGAGTPGSSLRALLLGPTLWGDENCDLNGPCADISFCDAHRLPYPDKTFGAVVASHVVEHVRRPDVVLRELHRVADRVFVITPKWWAAHTWLHPGHLWYRRDDGRFVRLHGGSHDGPRPAARALPRRRPR
jgi:SAM-dependent methyltransferase